MEAVGPDVADPRNLWRVHWFNGPDRKTVVDTPDHIVLPPELTGVKAPIVVLLGCRFPMIGAHKVLAAYACLVPRLVTGQFDPTSDRAVWPSTGFEPYRPRDVHLDAAGEEVAAACRPAYERLHAARLVLD